MKYRLAVASDIPALCAIEEAQPSCAQWGAAGWKTEMETTAGAILCAQEEAAAGLAGFIAWRQAAGVCEILNIGVAPAWCRQGVGYQLLVQAIERMQRQGAENITLEVSVLNLPALRLYQKAGFVKVGVRKNFYNGQEDACIMRLVK